MITSSFGYAWAAKSYRSLWMGLMVHGVGDLMVVVVAVILGWYPWPPPPHWSERTAAAKSQA